MKTNTRSPSHLRGNQNGFSVLEALVATALIAGAFLPLLILQGQLTRTAIAVEENEKRLRHEANALAYLEVLNPSLRPTGQEPLGEGAILVWEAELVEPMSPARDVSGAPGRFNIGLYNMNAQIRFADGRVLPVPVRRPRNLSLIHI